MTHHPPILYSIPAYDGLAAEVCRLAGAEPGRIERRTFPDGERYRRVLDRPRGRAAVLLGGTTDDGATLEILDLAAALVAQKVLRLTLILPFLGYSTMEREVREGEAVVAESRARLFSSLPRPPLGLEIVFLDLHSEGLPSYFDHGLYRTHLYAKAVIAAAVRELAGSEADFVLAATDAGRAKWVQSLANEMGVDAGFVYKRRLGGAATEIVGTNATVEGRTVVIYDDMIRSGGSLLDAARAYRRLGATRVHAVTTHGIFCGDALERLLVPDGVEEIACTDSYLPRQGEHPKLRVRSIAGVLADFLRRAEETVQT